MFEEYAISKQTKNRSEWLELRFSGIGGSEASVILNENPYKTKLELFEEKLKIVKAQDLSNNEAVKKGIELEPLIRKIFSVEYKDKYEVLEDDNTYFSKKYPFMLANVDGILIDKITNEVLGLEIKTARVKKIWEEVPIYYYIQCQHYMAVLGLNKFILVAYFTTHYNNEIRVYEIERSEEDIEYIINQEKAFYNSLKENKEPKNEMKLKI